MISAPLVTCLVLALVPLGFAWWVWRRVPSFRRLPRWRLWLLGIGGALAAVLASIAELQTLQFAGLSLHATARASLAPALAMVLFCAPLEEALKAGVVWPLYAGRSLSNGRTAASYVVILSAAFASTEILLWFGLWKHQSWLDLARLAVALPAQFFFSGLWGYMLGGEKRDRYFGIVWLAATATRGVCDHVVFGRGPALLAVVVPLLALMALGTAAVLKEEASAPGRPTSYSLFEAPNVAAVREVMSRHGRPLMLHWIGFGVLVTTGVTLVFLGAAVYVGHRWGVDFALADGEGVASIAPIALLATALLLAFPVSGYLLARASGASSVLEPAWATGAAILVVFFLFSVTEPTALIVALAVAPAALTFACVGAWLGLTRQ